MIKFVHSGDIHLGTAFSGLDEKRARILRRELVKSFCALIDHCIETEADLLLLSGDIFDCPVPSSDDVEIFRREISRLRKTKAFAALGNHDYGAGELMTSCNIHVFPAWPERAHIPGLNVCVSGRSFSSQNEPYSLMKGLEPEPGVINVLCLHANLDGEDYNPITRRELAGSGFNYAALGHVHGCALEKCGSTTVCSSGCLAGRGFDETGEKGFISGAINPISKEISVDLVPSPSPRFHELHFHAADYADEENMLDEILSGLSERDLYRIIIKGTTLPESYIESRLSDKAFYVSVRCESPSMPDTPLIRLLKEELSENPSALDIALKALVGRTDEI